MQPPLWYYYRLLIPNPSRIVDLTGAEYLMKNCRSDIYGANQERLSVRQVQGRRDSLIVKFPRIQAVDSVERTLEQEAKNYEGLGFLAL